MDEGVWVIQPGRNSWEIPSPDCAQANNRMLKDRRSVYLTLELSWNAAGLSGSVNFGKLPCSMYSRNVNNAAVCKVFRKYRRNYNFATHYRVSLNRAWRVVDECFVTFCFCFLFFFCYPNCLPSPHAQVSAQKARPNLFVILLSFHEASERKK